MNVTSLQLVPNPVLYEDRSITRPFKSVGMFGSLPGGQVLVMSINHRQRLPDIDPEETDEWLEALRSVVDAHGVERARLLLHELMSESEDLDVEIAPISPPMHPLRHFTRLDLTTSSEVRIATESAMLFTSKAMEVQGFMLGLSLKED